MTTRVRLLQMIVLSMAIAFGLPWSTPRLSGQAKPSYAIIIDDTGSMTDDLAAAKAAAKGRIDQRAEQGSFPRTVLITFKDTVMTRLTSDNPAELKDEIDKLEADGGAECPEASLQALMDVAPLLQYGGHIFLATDANSRADGPDTKTVDDALNENGIFNLPDNNHRELLISGLLGGCPPEDEGVPLPAGVRAFASGLSANHDPIGQNGPARDSHAFTAAALATGSPLGLQSHVTTFSALAGEGGGFVFIPRDPEADAVETAERKTRYFNAATNMLYTDALPTVRLVTPPAVPQGGDVTVELSGGSTNFQGSSTVSVGGTGVTVLSQSVLSPTRMLVTLSVSGSAALGFRDVTVTTNLGGGTIETARGVGPLQITTRPIAASIVGVTPSQIPQGKTTDVTITGAGTHFVNGTSTVSLGTGVTVNRVAVSSATALTANVTVSAGASTGFRDVTVTTGAEVAAEDVVGPLLIIAAPAIVPRIVTATPSSGSRGKHLSVTLTGENTHFDATTTVGFGGAGISVTSVAVTSATSLTASISIAPDATLGFRSVVATTGSEVAVLSGGFNTLGGSTHDLLVDFGPRFGLWLRVARTEEWVPFHPTSPEHMVTGDLDGNGIDEVILDFGPVFGIWIWANDSRWYQLHSSSALRMVTGDLDGNGRAELLIDFPEAGIWVWANDTFWYQLHETNSNHMVIGDLDGNGKAEAIIDFPVDGIWVCGHFEDCVADNTSWFSLDSGNARSIVVDDFDGDGRAEVVADFDGIGILRFALGRSWSHVLPLNASRLAAGDVDGNGQSDLIVDVGNPHGIWMLLNGRAWSQLHRRTSRQLLTSDLDNNGKADIIVGFGALGLWEYANNETWIQLHTANPRAIVAGHIKAP